MFGLAEIVDVDDFVAVKASRDNNDALVCGDQTPFSVPMEGLISDRSKGEFLRRRQNPSPISDI
jgi:hypothetical protein